MYFLWIGEIAEENEEVENGHAEEAIEQPLLGVEVADEDDEGGVVDDVVDRILVVHEHGEEADGREEAVHDDHGQEADEQADGDAAEQKVELGLGHEVTRH